MSCMCLFQLNVGACKGERDDSWKKKTMNSVLFFLCFCFLLLSGDGRLLASCSRAGPDCRVSRSVDQEVIECGRYELRGREGRAKGRLDSGNVM